VGTPVAEIEKAARDCQSTVIVAGTSGKSAWSERWIGSVPKALAEKSLFPTLLVPPEKK
jgi:nucleotide-binding universal stress UspA family protein